MPQVDSKAVFINAPFDLRYEQLFVTLVGTLVFLGREPHCVLEVMERGDGRLARIYELVRACRVSVHDLSRISTPARFNMPFELGLACAIKLAHPNGYDVVVLDAKPYRIDRTLSDYKGRDPLIHGGTCEGMTAALLDAFETDVPDPEVEFRRAARDLRNVLAQRKRRLKSPSIFRPSLFKTLVANATKIAFERQFITR
jgi:hypothetical protein